MTDDRPTPRYGEYAPAGSVPAVSETAAVAPVDAEPTAAVTPRVGRRNWDVALTTALLLVGVLDVVNSFSRFGNLAALLRTLYDQQGLGTFTSDQLADDMGIAINVTRVVLLVVAVGFGLWMLGRNRLAFWVPLSAGALAFIIVVVCLLVVVITDPALSEYAIRQSTNP
jgi:Family of unknown function (DUF6264)